MWNLQNNTGFPCGSVGKEYACSIGDLGSIPGLGRSPGEGKGYPLQYSGLENSMDCIVHGAAKSRTGLSDFHFHKIIHDFIYKNNTNDSVYKTETDSQRKQMHSYQRGKGCGDQLGARH